MSYLLKIIFKDISLKIALYLAFSGGIMVTCPISKNKVDSNVIRLNGLITLLFIALGAFFYIFWILLMIDFLTRSFFIKYSPIANLSRFIINKLKIKPKAIDAAPKKFAARIGFLMSMILVALYFSNTKIALYFAIFFSIPVFLETIFSFCIGCHLYSFLIKIKVIKIKLN